MKITLDLNTIEAHLFETALLEYIQKQDGITRIWAEGVFNHFLEQKDKVLEEQNW